MLTLQQFEQAKKRLAGISIETPLQHSMPFSKETENQSYIKLENLQTTGSFKIRGAYNKISKLTPEEKKAGLIASSAGNHAQGVAYAAQKLGVKATIVMPKTAPLIKVEATRGYGAKVILCGDGYDDAFAEAKRLMDQENLVFIHPFNDLDVIEGQGTIALEVLEKLPDAHCIVAPIGGGGLISGIALAAKAIKPDITIIGVEPDGAQAMKISVENKRLTQLDDVDTIADGVAVKNPGELTYPIIRDYVDEIITVTDFDIMDAFLLLLDKHKVVGENAGVLSLAALKKINRPNQKIVSIVSGGNIDVLTMSAMINRGLFSRGRIFCFSVELPDRPGQLQKIAEILARMNANVIKLDHNQFKAFDRFMDVELEVTVETNGHRHVKRIVEELEKEGFSVTSAC
ncbi:threonine ammonia-lyase [Dethiobacter alkaliphilus]|uniref:threonine ammonia-lyase n=1 Tax=Dethiobacter alkaliphilus TaxID=427926 RepID=UPI002227A9A6|nr:threonine ammonia-lyase [Dethiobacter alkaliphilus]MCW3488932.1 threonine ammonia-lyase [Dethiobacter alkaliphilus]